MQNNRILSLDVFRGLTMILMTIVNNPGDWGAVYWPLLHAEWHGCTLTDLVFPFFVFTMGAAIPFGGESTGRLSMELLQKIFVRSLRIFCLGLALNFFSKIQLFSLEGFSLILLRLLIMVGFGVALMGNFKLKTKFILAIVIFSFLVFCAFSGLEHFKNMRVPGVLQRIGIVYFIVAIIFYAVKSYRVQLGFAVFILLGYWFAMTQISVPEFGAPNLNVGTNLAAWIDFSIMPNNLYIVTKTWDPEGILSTLPAIITSLIGIWIGILLKKQAKNVSTNLIVIGTFMVIIGYLWGMVFPINKALWTSSYVVYTAGIATIVLGALNYIFVFKKAARFSKFFILWGVNPMIVFYASGIIPRVLGMIKLSNGSNIDEKISLVSYIYKNAILAFIDSPQLASLVGALLYVIIWSIILVIFNSKKLIFKV